MKVTIESTLAVELLDIDGRLVPARRWEGSTEGGVPVVAYVARISPQTHDAAANARFAAELKEVPNPFTAAAHEDRVALLAAEVLRLMRRELTRLPPNRDNVFVALNALASAAALVITGADRRAREFFDRAVADNVAELAAKTEDGGPGG